MRTRDKWEIFSNKKKLRIDPAGPFAKIYINEDQSKEERQQQKALRDKMKELQAADTTLKGSIKGNTLFIYVVNIINLIDIQNLSS